MHDAETAAHTPGGRPYVLAETPWKTVAATRYDVAVLPWGATEAHNYHLPYGTDTIQSHYVAVDAARRAWEAGARVIVLPAVPFGVQTGQLDIPLCMNMNPATQAALLRDLAVSLSVQGITRLVVLNGHGGNDFRQMIRELQPQVDLFICCINWYQVLDPRPWFDEPGDHAGELETSVMQCIAPELVLPLSQAGHGRTRPFRIEAFRQGWAWTPRRWTAATVDTGVGNPGAATAAKGAAYIHAVAERISGFLIELGAADVDDMYGDESPVLTLS
jgi:creatinine amidohydrolase